MNFDFKIGKINRPIVKLTKTNLTFNKRAVELLNVPEYIAIGIDRAEKKLAFKATKKDETREPVYPFAINGRNDGVLVSATKIRNEMVKLLQEKIENGGIAFVLEIDEETKFGIIDLTSGEKCVSKK